MPANFTPPRVAPDLTFFGPTRTFAVTIPNGTALSATVDMGFLTLVGILLPAAWTSAGLTLLVSGDGVTYGNLFDSTGTEFAAAAVAAGTYVRISPNDTFGARFIQVRSGTSAVPVNQGADRSLTLVGREV